MLEQSGTLAGVTLLAASSTASAAAPASASVPADPFRYCLNTSTIRGQKLSLPQQISVAAEAGYQAIEPWMGDLHQFVQAGGNLPELKARIDDAGLTVESAIGFSAWIVDDPDQRRQGQEALRRDMDALRQIGGRRIAAPPAGATQTSGLDLFRVAERYAEILDLGQSLEVVPQLELWGFSKSLSRLGEIALVAIESGHPQACLLLDIYHLYKGGSSFAGVKHLAGSAMHVLHLNDYPGDVSRELIGDADRVFPGDGVAPIVDVVRQVHATGFCEVLSLELFNPHYWQRDPLAVAREGLQKMRAVVHQALGTQPVAASG
jgi:2-keto-myo-inositol isomerase